MFARVVVPPREVGLHYATVPVGRHISVEMLADGVTITINSRRWRTLVASCGIALIALVLGAIAWPREDEWRWGNVDLQRGGMLARVISAILCVILLVCAASAFIRFLRPRPTKLGACRDRLWWAIPGTLGAHRGTAAAREIDTIDLQRVGDDGARHLTLVYTNGSLRRFYLDATEPDLARVAGELRAALRSGDAR